MTTLPIMDRLEHRERLQKSAYVEAQHPRGHNGRWVAKPLSIGRVAANMGVRELPVVVRSSSTMKNSYGTHKVGLARLSGGQETVAHVVTVAADLPPETASRTIYHELKHAGQEERVRRTRDRHGPTAAQRLREAYDAGGYDRRLLEVQAREAEGLQTAFGDLAAPNPEHHRPTIGERRRKLEGLERRYRKSVERVKRELTDARRREAAGGPDAWEARLDVYDLETKLEKAELRHVRAVARLSSHRLNVAPGYSEG